MEEKQEDIEVEAGEGNQENPENLDGMGKVEYDMVEMSEEHSGGECQ